MDAPWTDWTPCGPGFRGLHEYDHGQVSLAMWFEPTFPDKPGSLAKSDAWLRLRDVWLEIPSHPCALGALARSTYGYIILRYAALHWQRQRVSLRAHMRSRARFAAWGAQVTELFAAIAAEIDEQSFHLLLRPFVMTDIGDHARVGFMPVTMDERVLPPEAVKSQDSCDERSLVFAIGHAMRDLCQGEDGDESAALRYLLARCTDPRPRKRFQTLVDLRTAWRNVGARDVVRSGAELEAWPDIEEGYGWLALGKPERALAASEKALAADPAGIPALQLRSHALAKVAAPVPPARPIAARVWADVRDEARDCETKSEYARALELYRSVRLDGLNDVAIHTARARCQLALGAASAAASSAARALAADATHLEALSIRARALLLDNQPADALTAADAWIGVRSTEAAAHYARGRALFALARFIPAREAFDRACRLDPKMLEALLLRREADRSARRVRESVGMQPEIDLELPEHLSELRAVLATGRVDEMLRTLEQPRYEHDPVAKLFHARCLAFCERYDDAIAMFEQVATHEAIIGKAYALLATCRAAEALRVFDAACATRPGDLDAIEGRAAALRALGRVADADDEIRRVVQASGGRSELRIGGPR